MHLRTLRSMDLLFSTINHPRLKSLSQEAVRSFLQRYDSYVVELKEPSRQISGEWSGESSHPVHLKSCVDTKLLRSLIDFGAF